MGSADRRRQGRRALHRRRGRRHHLGQGGGRGRPWRGGGPDACPAPVGTPTADSSRARRGPAPGDEDPEAGLRQGLAALDGPAAGVVTTAWSRPSPPWTAAACPCCPASSTATTGPARPGAATRRPGATRTGANGTRGSGCSTWAVGQHARCRRLLAEPGGGDPRTVRGARGGLGHGQHRSAASSRTGGGTGRHWTPSAWTRAEWPGGRPDRAGRRDGCRHADGRRRWVDRRLLRADRGRGRPSPGTCW